MSFLGFLSPSPTNRAEAAPAPIPETAPRRRRGYCSWFSLQALCSLCSRTSRHTLIEEETDLETADPETFKDVVTRINETFPATNVVAVDRLTSITAAREALNPITTAVRSAIAQEFKGHDALKERAAVISQIYSMNLRNILAIVVLLEIMFSSVKPTNFVGSLFFGLFQTVVVLFIISPPNGPYNARAVRDALASGGHILPANADEIEERFKYLKSKPLTIVGSEAFGAAAALIQSLLSLNSTWYISESSPLMILMIGLIAGGYFMSSAARANTALHFLWDLVTGSNQSMSRLSLLALYTLVTVACLPYSYPAGNFFTQFFMQGMNTWLEFFAANAIGHVFALSQIGMMLNELQKFFSDLYNPASSMHTHRSDYLKSLVIALITMCVPTATLGYLAFNKGGLTKTPVGFAFSIIFAILSAVNVVTRARPMSKILKIEGTTWQRFQKMMLPEAVGTLDFQIKIILMPLLKKWAQAPSIDSSLSAELQAQKLQAYLAARSFVKADIQKCLLHFLTCVAIKEIRTVYAGDTKAIKDHELALYALLKDREQNIPAFINFLFEELHPDEAIPIICGLLGNSALLDEIGPIHHHEPRAHLTDAPPPDATAVAVRPAGQIPVGALGQTLPTSLPDLPPPSGAAARSSSAPSATNRGAGAAAPYSLPAHVRLLLAAALPATREGHAHNNTSLPLPAADEGKHTPLSHDETIDAHTPLLQGHPDADGRGDSAGTGVTYGTTASLVSLPYSPAGGGGAPAPIGAFRAVLSALSEGGGSATSIGSDRSPIPSARSRGAPGSGSRSSPGAASSHDSGSPLLPGLDLDGTPAAGT